MPCTGRVDVGHILRALEHGAGGVLVAGCPEGHCHFLYGNLKARKKVQYVKGVLLELEIEPERVEMFNLSAAQGARFSEIAREMVDSIVSMGPWQGSSVKAGSKRKEDHPARENCK